MAAVAAPELATQQHTPLQQREGEGGERRAREDRRDTAPPVLAI